MAKVKVRNKCIYWIRGSATLAGPWSEWQQCSLEFYQAAGEDGGVRMDGNTIFRNGAFFQRFKSDTGENPNGQTN